MAASNSVPQYELLHGTLVGKMLGICQLDVTTRVILVMLCLTDALQFAVFLRSAHPPDKGKCEFLRWVLHGSHFVAPNAWV